MNKTHKIADAFAAGKAFIPFITCGDPDLETTKEIIRSMAANGADLIELGIPFSDPTAEGPILQSASLRALKGGATTDKIFQMVRELREDACAPVNLPMVFLTYANVIFSYDAEKFIRICSEIGINGLIIPDLPFEEKGEFNDICQKYDVALISLIAPTSANRAAMIARSAQGFVYIVSSLGVSGADTKSDTDISSLVELVRENTSLPCAAGPSVSTPDQAAMLAQHADGVMTDAAIIKVIEKHGRDAAAPVGEYVKSMKEALPYV